MTLFFVSNFAKYYRLTDFQNSFSGRLINKFFLANWLSNISPQTHRYTTLWNNAGKQKQPETCILINNRLQRSVTTWFRRGRTYLTSNLLKIYCCDVLNVNRLPGLGVVGMRPRPHGYAYAAYWNASDNDDRGLDQCLSSIRRNPSPSRQRHNEVRIHTPVCILSDWRPFFVVCYRVQPYWMFQPTQSCSWHQPELQLHNEWCQHTLYT